MKKLTTKLMVTFLALTLAVTVVVMSSYAWMTLSDNPATENIRISIAGGNTILMAADRTETVDGVVYHYPDVFDDTLNIAAHDSYEYLSSLGGLTPVSTADGVNWVLPTYYDMTDEAVQNGGIASGTIKPVEHFSVETDLAHANLTNTQMEQVAEGSYLYLDFWVVSPGRDYKLRVSAGDDNGGSFLIDLLRPTETDENGDDVMDSYTLVSAGEGAAACARVGFLVNPDYATAGALTAYRGSYTYNEKYTALRGDYHEPNSGSMVYSSDYRFTIYEPNADLHPEGESGGYAVTRPLSWDGSTVSPVDVADILTAQLTSEWKSAQSGTVLEQMFQTAMAGKTFRSASLPDIERDFYYSYLQGQVMPYVTKGQFLRRTAELYSSAVSGLVSSSRLTALDNAGATDDVYIVELQQNVPQRIRMFVWLEGQDADCVDSASATAFALSIELAGSNE